MKDMTFAEAVDVLRTDFSDSILSSEVRVGDGAPVFGAHMNLCGEEYVLTLVPTNFRDAGKDKAEG